MCLPKRVSHALQNANILDKDKESCFASTRFRFSDSYAETVPGNPTFINTSASPSNVLKVSKTPVALVLKKKKKGHKQSFQTISFFFHSLLTSAIFRHACVLYGGELNYSTIQKNKRAFKRSSN